MDGGRPIRDTTHTHTHTHTHSFQSRNQCEGRNKSEITTAASLVVFFSVLSFSLVFLGGRSRAAEDGRRAERGRHVAGRFGQRPDQEEALALLAGEDGRALVVVDQLVDRVEPALADDVEGALDVDAEVLVAAGRLQRHGVIADLRVPDRKHQKMFLKKGKKRRLTDVGLRGADQEVAVVSVLVEQVVALGPRDGAVEPRLPSSTFKKKRKKTIVISFGKR